MMTSTNCGSGASLAANDDTASLQHHLDKKLEILDGQDHPGFHHNNNAFQTAIQDDCYQDQGSESGASASRLFDQDFNQSASDDQTQLTSPAYGTCNPHGIDTILNRRRSPSSNTPVPEQRQPSLQPYFNAHQLSQLTSAAAAAGTKLEDLQAAAAAHAATTRASLYWPGLQGLMNNPNVWRDRLALNSKLTFNSKKGDDSTKKINLFLLQQVYNRETIPWKLLRVRIRRLTAKRNTQGRHFPVSKSLHSKRHLNKPSIWPVPNEPSSPMPWE